MLRHITQWLITFMLLSASISSTHAEEVKVAAAASLSFVLEDIAKQFHIDTGHQLKISFASSGTLTHQIIQGAPFEIFLSADEYYVGKLHEKSVTIDQGAIYTHGQLAMFSSSEKLSADSHLAGLKRAIKKNQIQHFSIPNPKLAPYGKVAQQALESAGLWEKITPLLIVGENASQSAMFISTQSVDGALLPLPLAQILEIKGYGNFKRLDKNLYTELKQRMVLMKDASKTAHIFYHYLQQTSAQDIFLEHGFAPTKQPEISK